MGKLRRRFNVFDDQCNAITSQDFQNIFDAIAWVKTHYTHKEWLESELTLNEVTVDDKGTIVEFADQINPFC